MLSTLLGRCHESCAGSFSLSLEEMSGEGLATGGSIGQVQIIKTKKELKDKSLGRKKQEKLLEGNKDWAQLCHSTQATED